MSLICKIFTESAPLGGFSQRVPHVRGLSVCLGQRVHFLRCLFTGPGGRTHWWPVTSDQWPVTGQLVYTCERSDQWPVTSDQWPVTSDWTISVHLGEKLCPNIIENLSDSKKEVVRDHPPPKKSFFLSISVCFVIFFGINATICIGLPYAGEPAYYA